MPVDIEIGESAEVSFVASNEDMASSLAITPDDNFPEVFATSRMIALMELAAAKVMRKSLGPNQLSVGVGVNVKHIAATPNNTKVRGVATFLGLEGRLFKFRVEAFDVAGIVGEGEHTRAIVDSDRLVRGAQTRINAR